MRDALCLTFEVMNEGGNSIDSNNDEETAMAAGQFKGRCMWQVWA
jgi:hypothetical protein